MEASAASAGSPTSTYIYIYINIRPTDILDDRLNLRSWRDTTTHTHSRMNEIFYTARPSDDVLYELFTSCQVNEDM
jgi:hypothetical protein